VAASVELRAAQTALQGSPWRARLFTVTNSVSPADQLQEDLRTALRRAGVEPTNFKVLPASGFRGLRVHRVEFASVMTVDQLRAFFAALGAQPRTVRVERLQLDAPAVQRADENPRLNVLMEAQGFSADAAPVTTRLADAR
jgi:hypothetical protein